MNGIKNQAVFFIVMAVLTVFPRSLWGGAEKVTFNGEDNVKLVGKFSKPSSPSKWTVILLHGVGSVKGEWDSFFDLLSKNGFGVLSYDQRGHGESTKKIDGGAIDFQTFYARGLTSEWGKMVQDLGSAVKFLKEKYKIDPKTVAVGGASVGANISFRYAVDHQDAPYAILLSPGMDYQGISLGEIVPRYGNRPLFMAASPRDGYSYQSVISLQSLDPSLKERKSPSYAVYIESQNQGHGVQMFKRKKADEPSNLEQNLLRWIENQKRR